MLRLRERYVTSNGELTDAGWQALTAEFDALEAQITGGGVSDGDKGDITVSGSGAVWTIDAFDERVDDRVAALLVAGTNVTLTYNDGAGTLTVDAAGGVVALDDLSDVIISTPATDDVLIYNGTNWVNAPATAGGDPLVGWFI